MTYPRKVPASLIKKYITDGYWKGKTLFDFLAETTAKYPDSVAIKYKNESYTFSDFKRISLHLASQLKKAGIGKGDVVSVQLPNCPQFMFLQVALSIIGAIIDPVHLVARKRDLYSTLNFCSAKALVFQSSYANRDFVEEYADILQNVPSIASLFLVGAPADGNLPEKCVPFDELTASNQGGDTIAPCSEADDVFYLNFTSGTEGDPKGFLHTFNTILAFAYRYGNAFRFSPNDSLLTLSPLTHTFGHIITYICAMRGAKVVLFDKFEPGEALNIIKSENVTYIQGTPAHLYGILNHDAFEKYDISSVRIVMTGGALVPKDLLLKVRNLLGAEILTGYGMGETLMHTLTMADDPDWAKLETVGKAFGGSEIKIFDPIPSSDNPDITVGEIAYRGPYLFIEYFRNSARTDETRDDEGWFRTGDVGYVDESGYLRITGRKKDIINRGGTKIYPGEVENVLKFHPKIRDISIVGMYDQIMGERSCAFVIIHPGESAITLDEVERFLEDRSVTPYKWPERLEIVSEFPMTPTGKVRKEELRKMLDKLTIAERKN